MDQTRLEESPDDRARTGQYIMTPDTVDLSRQRRTVSPGYAQLRLMRVSQANDVAIRRVGTTPHSYTVKMREVLFTADCGTSF